MYTIGLSALGMLYFKECCCGRQSIFKKKIFCAV